MASRVSWVHGGVTVCVHSCSAARARYGSCGNRGGLARIPVSIQGVYEPGMAHESHRVTRHQSLRCARGATGALRLQAGGTPLGVAAPRLRAVSLLPRASPRAPQSTRNSPTPRWGPPSGWSTTREDAEASRGHGHPNDRYPIFWDFS